MKNVFLLLFSLLLISCSTQKVLKTDTPKDIDLSGRWNATDAEIASNELFTHLIAAPWLNDFKANNEWNPQIEVEVFKSNVDGIGENLTHYFENYIKADSSVELMSEDANGPPDFKLYGEIQAEESAAEGENFIEYTIYIRLNHHSGRTVQKDKTVVKKYIKN